MNSFTKEGKYKDLMRNASNSYRTVGVIGHGSFGTVFAARNEFGELIAIKAKKNLPDRALMAKSNELFRSELESLYNLDHANILKLLGAEFKKGDVVSLITEHIRGETLDKIIAQYGTFPEPTIQSFMKQIFDALSFMHSNYVMHRDLKCSNIMLVANQYIKVIDFGMAKHFDPNDTTVIDYGMTANTVVGTYPYMSPEILQFSTYNSKTDIWSAGVCLYEMATGDMFIRITRSNQRVEQVYLAVYPGVIQVSTLSVLANDFLQSCLIKQLEQRPLAYQLLQHPFLRNARNPLYAQQPYYNFQNFSDPSYFF